MNENDLLAVEIEKENEREEQSKVQVMKREKGQVAGASIVWILGIVVLDAASAFIVWQATVLFYGILWFFVGAGGLWYSEWLRSRVGNNEEQAVIAKLGVQISAGAVFLMGVVSGALYLLNYTESRPIMVAIEFLTVTLFFYHLVQSYRYREADDEYKEMQREAREEALLEHDIRKAHRAARRVASKKSRINVENGYRREHGPAFDAAYRGFNSDTEQVKARPTQPPSEK